MRKLIAVLAAAAVMAAGCSAGGTKVPARHHATAKASTAAYTAADAQQTCSKLAASALPSAAYDLRIIDEINAMVGSGNASPAQVRHAHVIVNAEIRADCPQFAGVIKG